MSDLISRQAAIDALCKTCFCGPAPCSAPCDGIKEIRKLPFAQPMNVQEAYYRGKCDGIKECTARLKKMKEEFMNGRSDIEESGD